MEPLDSVQPDSVAETSASETTQHDSGTVGGTTQTTTGIMSSTPTTPAPVESQEAPIEATSIEDFLKKILEKGTPEQIAEVNNMESHSANVVEVTVAELKQAVAYNPGHEIATVFATAIAAHKDHEKVYVEQPDLQALLQNRKVKSVVRTMDDGSRVRTKYLV